MFPKFQTKLSFFTQTTYWLFSIQLATHAVKYPFGKILYNQVHFHSSCNRGIVIYLKTQDEVTLLVPITNIWQVRWDTKVSNSFDIICPVKLFWTPLIWKEHLLKLTFRFSHKCSIGVGCWLLASKIITFSAANQRNPLPRQTSTQLLHATADKARCVN